VYGDAKVSGDAKVYGYAKVYGDAEVYGDAKVYRYANVYGDTVVSGDAEVSGNADYLTIHGLGSVHRATTAFKCVDKQIRIQCGCFYGTIDEFREEVTRTRDGKIEKEYLKFAELVEIYFGLNERKDTCDDGVELRALIDNSDFRISLGEAIEAFNAFSETAAKICSTTGTV
jgi:hypothetical protein